MPITLIGRQVFLASPGDVTEERELCRQVLTEFNATRAQRLGATFLVRGWEQVPGGIGRPQGQINPHLDECDYMILILGHRWGSPTDIDGKYTSGTEEEFAHCLELLASDSAPMRDVLVLLKVLDPVRVADPGEQLKRVLDFRKRLEDSKQILYVTFDSIDKLRIALERSLEAWSQPLGERTPQVVSLPAGEYSSPAAGQPTSDLLAQAKDLYENGMIVQADGLYAVAIQTDDPEALSEYAQFSRRTGNLDLALELNTRLLRLPALLRASDSQSVKYRVRSLANVGVIHRKRGDIEGSKGALQEAIRTVEQSDHRLPRELCYAMDNYGLSLARAGDSAAAKEQFQRSYDLRVELGDDHGAAQSAINIGRISLQDGELRLAEELFSEALAKLDPESGARERANAQAGIAETRLRQDNPEGVAELLLSALAANEAHKESDGVSITYGLLARLELLNGDDVKAAQYAASCAAEASKSGNLVGSATALWIQAEVALRDGRNAEALELLTEAESDARRGHDVLLASDIAESSERARQPIG